MKLFHRLLHQAHCSILSPNAFQDHEFLLNDQWPTFSQLTSFLFLFLHEGRLDFFNTMPLIYVFQFLHFNPTITFSLAPPFKVDCTQLLIFLTIAQVTSFQTNVLHFVVKQLHIHELFNQLKLALTFWFLTQAMKLCLMYWHLILVTFSYQQGHLLNLM